MNGAPTCRTFSWIAALALTALAGCNVDTPRPGPFAQCLDEDSRPAVVDVSSDPINCGDCGRRCMLPGVRTKDQACLLYCAVDPDRGCAPGYFDADHDPYNGCECRGGDIETCTLCGAAEIPFNAVDDDCDLRTDERVPAALDPTHTFDGMTHPLRPNGPEGALDDPPDASRVTCGDRPCTLPPGAVDVTCHPDALTCLPLHAPEGLIVVGDAPAGPHKRRGELDCADGVDDDGNGIVDDGPTCETLVTAVPHTECHGAGPSARCPPTWVPMEGHPGQPGTAGPTVARITYDYFLDDQEATLAQVQRWLAETGRCDRIGGVSHPLCDETTDPRRPAGLLDWCDAYSYCQWAGKRLPTELEWIHAFGGAHGTFDPVEAMCGGTEAQVPECRASESRPVGGSGGHVDKGVGYVSTLYDVAGNVAEWQFDARGEPCELPWIECEAGVPIGYETPDDPVVHAPDGERRRHRIIRGGGYGSELGAASPEARQWAEPGVRVPHYGVRCARTFEPGRQPLETPIVDSTRVPYDSTLSARALAQCAARPIAGRIARRTPAWLGRAVEACVPTVTGEAPFQGLVARLAAPVRPLLLNIDQSPLGNGLIAAAPGLVPGAEALWLRDHPPLEVYRPEPCDAQSCAFDLAAPYPWVVELTDESEATLEVSGGRPLSPTEESCLGPTGAATAWAFEIKIRRSELDGPLGTDEDIGWACEAFGCAEPLPGARCADACGAWWVPVHVALEHLTVPPSD